MNNIFIDTNMAMDLLLERQPFYNDAASLFSLAELKYISLTFSSLGFSTLDYIISKKVGKGKSKLILKRFLPLVKVLAVDEDIVEQALNSDFTDFEDAIQYEVAKRNDQDVIITRNIKDYKKSDIPVFLPGDYLKILKIKYFN